MATLVSGLVVIALGGLLSAVRRTFTVGLAVQAAGASLVGIAGFSALGSAASGSDFTGAFAPRVGLDGLTGVFLGALGLVAAPSLVFARRYLHSDRAGRTVGVLVAAFLGAMVLVLCARDPLTLLAGWEAMTLVPAAVILVSRHGDRAARRSVLTYLAITHLGGVGTWVSVLLLADAGAMDTPGAVRPGSGLQTVIALAALVGMGTKAGVMPVHVWLPRAHPMAPAPVSALMSGVMIKVAIYALVRVLVQWLAPVPTWFGVLVLAVGAVSALGGVVYAIFQHELKRLLALHSIENIGIIVLGLGACLVLTARGADLWAAVALGGALLHTVNHAVFKALLFLCAGAFERATGTLDLDRMGGLLRAMPWTGAAFLVGAMAIAGLPPLNGFVSEWVTLQALLRLPIVGGVGDGLAGVLALAALAGTAALALLCFVKVVGLVLLGRRRAGSGEPVPVHEASPSMVAGTVFLAGVCVVLGAAPGLLLRPLVDLAGAVRPGAVPPGTVLAGAGVTLPDAATLPAPGFVVVLVAVAAILVVLRRGRAAAPAPTWACGQQVGPELDWTGAGFSKSLRLVLSGVLRPRRDLVMDRRDGVVQEIRYAGRVPQLIDERVYRPAVQRSLVATAGVRRLQSGSLAAYVSYLVVLVVGLLGAARTGVIG